MADPAMKFNPGFLTDQELVDSFCVRVPEFELLVQTIRESTDSSNPHQLIIGPRGTGKTTLLLRVACEVKRDPELSAAWFPIIFPEESYEIGTCGEFWLQCLLHLANQVPQDDGIDLARSLAEVRTEQDDQRLGTRCLAAILDRAAREDKRLLLIVENLNMLFDEISDSDVGWQLRHTLQNEKRIFLLASASSRFEEIERYGRAMYDLFNVQELKRLDTDACSVLWKAVSDRDPDRNVVRSLEILTGGNPRLIAIVARFGALLSFPELMDNLLRLVDDHTEYFKSHLDALGVQERRVYLALARLWKPATAKEVSQHARLPTNNCSALLGRLVDRGAVLIAGGGRWRKQYYVAERMYNIYYLLRMGRGSDRLVEALVSFMRSFYSPSELQDHFKALIRDLGAVDPVIHRLLGQALELSERSDPEMTLGRAEYADLEKLAVRAEKLLRSENWDLLIRVCEETESKVSPDASVSELEYWANSRNLRITALIELDQLTKAESLCSATWSACSGNDSAPLLKAAAIAGAKRIELLALSGQSSEMILEASEGFLSRFGRDRSLGISEPQAAALFQKATALRSLGRWHDALAVHEELIERFEQDTSLGVERCVVSALHAKGLLLDQSGQYDRARKVYDSAIRRFGDGRSSETLGLVARVEVSKGASLCQSNQLKDALLCFNGAIDRFADHNSGEIAEVLAKARFNKAAILEALDDSLSAFHEYDKLARRLDSGNEPWAVELAAHAFLRKAIVLSNSDRVKEALAAFEALEDRFGENRVPEVVPTVCNAKLERAKLEIRIGRPEAALETVDDAIVRSNAIDDQRRLHAFLLRAEAYFKCDCMDECMFELTEFLELLAQVEEVPGIGMEALFAFTIRLGPEPLLELIEASPSAKLLHPFTIALRQELCMAVPAASEVLEVASDIRSKLNERRQLGASSDLRRENTMSKSQDVATGKWHEETSCLEKTGFFTKAQLSSDDFLRVLADRVRRFTTVVGYMTEGDPTPIGSGTFVRRTDGQCGILTAGHVVGAIKKATRNNGGIWVLSAQDREEVDWVRIAGMGMHGWGERNTGQRGPDIGWMPLSAHEAKCVEALGGVFHNRQRTIEDLAGEVCQISIVFGFVGAASSPRNKEVVSHAMFLGRTKQTASDDEDWDYGDYAISSSDDRIPQTHGGVSGSAVWRIDLQRDGRGKSAVRLEGVVYAQGNPGDRKLIAHGASSIRTILKEK